MKKFTVLSQLLKKPTVITEAEHEEENLPNEGDPAGLDVDGVAVGDITLTPEALESLLAKFKDHEIDVKSTVDQLRQLADMFVTINVKEVEDMFAEAIADQKSKEESKAAEEDKTEEEPSPTDANLKEPTKVEESAEHDGDVRAAMKKLLDKDLDDEHAHELYNIWKRCDEVEDKDATDKFFNHYFELLGGVTEELEDEIEDEDDIQEADFSLDDEVVTAKDAAKHAKKEVKDMHQEGGDKFDTYTDAANTDGEYADDFEIVEDGEPGHGEPDGDEAEDKLRAKLISMLVDEEGLDEEAAYEQVTDLDYKGVVNKIRELKGEDPVDDVTFDENQEYVSEDDEEDMRKRLVRMLMRDEDLDEETAYERVADLDFKGVVNKIHELKGEKPEDYVIESIEEDIQNAIGAKDTEKVRKVLGKFARKYYNMHSDDAGNLGKLAKALNFTKKDKDEQFKLKHINELIKAVKDKDLFDHAKKVAKLSKLMTESVNLSGYDFSLV